MRLITIARFQFVSEAQVARATLEAAGIDATLTDENAVRMEWGKALALGGVRLQVREEDAEEAREILDGITTSEEAPVHEDPAEPIRHRANEARSIAPPLLPEQQCARCGSEEIYRKTGRAKLFAKALLLSWGGAALLNLASCGAAMAGLVDVERTMPIVFAVATLIPFVAVLAPSLSPWRCRICGLEWRGRQKAN